MRARSSVAMALAGAAVLTTLGAARASRPASGAPCPAQPIPALSASVPEDVCIPDGFKDIAVEHFDDYSWRTFVALIWPATPGRRGVAATTRTVADTGPRVFETYKALWEIFRRNGTPPDPAYDRYDAAALDLCGTAVGFGDVVIGSDSGIDDIGQAGIGVLDPPIAAQNGRYVRTLTLFNQLAFDHIVSNRYYLRSALPPVPTPRPDRPVVDFPMGSVAVKTAWVDVAGLPAPLVKRLYTRRALVKRATGTGCARTTMGLIGMHVAQKTPSRPQWIWSTFEQKDLVPPEWADSPGAFVLNDGRRRPMAARNTLSLMPLAPEPAPPTNVVRDAEAQILTRTELANFAYQQLLKDTPWRYYRLVMTQWPRLEGNQADPIPDTVDGSIDNTFPGTGAFSAFANVTMETFDQHAVQLGCMSCHNRTRMATDFMWSVFDHAYPSRLAPATDRRPTTPE
ncbi:MAG: hypothetical protein ABI634_05890 [Acidobacteriota bacterium]